MLEFEFPANPLDCTPRLNDLLELAIAQRESVYIPTRLGNFIHTPAYVGASYSILNKGVNIVTDGALRTYFAPDESMGTDVDFWLIKPETATNGISLDHFRFEGVFIWPSASGTKLGGKAVSIDMTGVNSNASSVTFEGNYFAPGNDLSVHWVTENNVQGGPANTRFISNSFWEGVKLHNCGDSVTFANNILRSSAGSGRTGIDFRSIGGAAGQGSQFTIEENNFDCDGGAIFARNGLKMTILKNNIEQSHGTGTINGACVDLDGEEGGLAWATFSGNSIGAFQGADLQSILRINNAAGTLVAHNRISSGAPVNVDKAIVITSKAANTILGNPVNEIGTHFPVTVEDNGVGTMGIPRVISPLNGFSNAGAPYTPMQAYRRPDDGSVVVEGFLLCPASPNGKVVGVLPMGFRHGYAHRVSASGLVSGVSTLGSIDIQPNGDIIYYGPNATQISFTANFGGLGFISGNL
jgi:hypothetical protein